MNSEPTIPCPICDAPVFVKQVGLPTGDIARIYADPLTMNDEVIAFHCHQVGDVVLAEMH